MDLRPQLNPATGSYRIDLKFEMSRLQSLRKLGVKTMHLKDIALIADNSSKKSFHATDEFERVYETVFEAGLIA
jgi:hypothetical protein